MRAVRVILASAAMAHGVASDLESEMAWWGPLPSKETPIEDGNWFAQGVASATAGSRLDGLFLVDRRAGIDAQVVCGWERDLSDVADDGFAWGRAQLRLGSDPLAYRPGCAFAALGGECHLEYYLSLQGEVGYSAERKVVANAEVCFVFLRLRVENDDRVGTIRFGTGPRVLGTTGPWAWGVLADLAQSRGNRDGGPNVTQDGDIAEAFIIYRPWQHVLGGFEVQAAHNVCDQSAAGSADHNAIRFTMSLGVVF
jgi:hypothetical protein